MVPPDRTPAGEPADSSAARLALLTIDGLLRVRGYNEVARAALAPGGEGLEGLPLRDVFPWSPERVHAAARAAVDHGRSASVRPGAAAAVGQVSVHPLLSRGGVAGAVVTWVVHGGVTAGEDPLRILEEMTAMLAGVRSLDEAIGLIADQCMVLLGARGGALALRTGTGTLRIEAVCGEDPRHRKGDELPLTGAALLSETARTGASLVVDGPRRTYAAPLGSGSRAQGAVELEFDDTDERQQLVGVATALWALAIGRGRTYEAERAARGSLREATNHLAFLAESTRTLNESLELGETLTRLARLSVPRLGDICGIHLLRGTSPRLTASADADPGAAPTSLLWLRHPGGVASSAALRQVLDTGRAAVVRLDGGAGHAQLATGREAVEALRALDLASVAIVPLTVQGRVLGTMTVATRTTSVAREPHLVLAEEIGMRAGTAIERAQLYQEQAHAISQLQANLLPPELPRITGLELASCFVPSSRSGGVGGDFYDALRLQDGRALLVIGDVQGKGIPAAATTGLVRQAVRAVARTAQRPSDIVAHVNEVLQAGLSGPDEEHRLCTLCVLMVDPGPDGAAVVLASAGHPLPLLLSPGREVARVGHSGLLAGAFLDAVWVDDEVWLARGDMLLCVTDGVTERREGDRFFEDELAGTAREAAGAGARALVDEVRSRALAFSRSALSDDMAVLALRAV